MSCAPLCRLFGVDDPQFLRVSRKPECPSTPRDVLGEEVQQSLAPNSNLRHTQIRAAPCPPSRPTRAIGRVGTAPRKLVHAGSLVFGALPILLGLRLATVVRPHTT